MGRCPSNCGEQLRDALAGQRQCRRGQADDVLPVDHVHGGAAAEPAVAAHRDPGDHPVASAHLLDRHVDDDDVDAREILQLGIGDADAGVEDLAEHQHLTGPLRESSQRHVGGGQRHRVGFDRGDSQNWDENPSAGEQFDDESEHTRLLAGDADADHHVADTADGLAVGTEHHHPRESGRVDPVHRHHDSKGRE